MTIRLRLTLWYGLAMILTVAVVAAIVWIRSAADLRSSLDEALAVQVADATAGVEGDGSPTSNALREDPARPGIFTLVLDRTGQVIARSRTAPPTVGVVAPGVSTWRPPGADAGVALVAGTTRTGLTVVAGSSLGPIGAETDRLAALLAVVGAGAALVSLAGGWLLAGRALAPVRVLVEEADRIHASEGTLGRRLRTPHAEDDLGRLAATLNRMLDRVEDTLGRQRAFVASASHDLRTPIAAIRTELELAVRAGAPEERLRDAIEAALGDVARLGRLADGLLALAAQEASGRAIQAERIDLERLVSEVAGRSRAGEPWRTAAVELQVEPLAILTDRVRLEQAIANLVENAIRYSPAGTPVIVRAGLPDDAVAGEAASEMLVVDVLDRGPGVEADRVPGLFSPFSHPPTPDGGAGLGLATAAAAVRALGGRIGYRPRPGGGAWFWFSIPARQPRPVSAPRAARAGRRVAPPRAG